MAFLFVSGGTASDALTKVAPIYTYSSRVSLVIAHF